MFWAEKYRPDDTSQDNLMLQYADLLKTKEVPNILMHGPPGVGKTTLARLIIKHFQPNDLFTMNAVRYNEESFKFYCKNKIDIVKILFIDEADMLSKQAQHSISAFTNRYNVRCILICNDITKIVSQISDNFLTIPFFKYNMDVAHRIVERILQNENKIDFWDDIKPFYNAMNGDMRKIIMYSDFLVNCNMNCNNCMHYYAEDEYNLDWLKEKKTWSDLIDYATRLVANATSLHRFLTSIIQYHIDEVADIEQLYKYLSIVNFVETHYKSKSVDIWFCFVIVLYNSPLFKEYIRVNVVNRKCIIKTKINT